MVATEDVWAALKTVEDPELPLSIVEMGLVYDVRTRSTPEGVDVEIDMTFTAMGCPAMDILLGDVRDAVEDIDGVREITVNTVWDPPWTTDRLSEDARLVLQMAGVGV